MGKYTNQAGSYSQGMKMIKTALSNALDELSKIKITNISGDMDCLEENTVESVKLIYQSIESLKNSISANEKKLMEKAIALDQKDVNNLQEEDNNIVKVENKKTPIRGNIKNIMMDI